MSFFEEIVMKERTSSVTTKKLTEILKLIEDGEYLLPDFQRGYVWSLEQCRKLILSIINDSVVGGILIWKTKENIEISNMIESNVAKKYRDMNSYILDGQQRITSLYFAIRGGVYQGVDFYQLKFNVDATCLDELVVISKEEKDGYIPFCEINNFNTLHTKVKPEMLGFFAHLHSKITGYNITVFEFRTDDLDDAIFQFNALNSGGKKMSKEDILLSKIYSNDFKLKVEIAKVKADLQSFGVKEGLIMSCLALCLKDSYSTKEMLSIELKEVEDTWVDFVKYLKVTCDYLTSIGFSDFDSLPYSNCFMAINKSLFDNKVASLTNHQSKGIKKYIVSSGIDLRYGKLSTMRTIEDYKKLNKLLATGEDSIDVASVNDEDIIHYGKMNKSSAYKKVLMWLFVQNSPISLLNNNAINTDGSSFSRRYCKNLHHIFPKNFMKNADYKYEVDHVVNICIIESQVNSKLISDKAPSIYLKELNEKNADIKVACESHLIDFDIAVKDDYDKFFESRMAKIKDLVLSYFS